MKYRQLKKEDVQRVMDQQIDEKGQTTTLDVKNQLRQEGFWAEQAPVSQFMNELSEEVQIDWEDAGGHRIYHATFDTGSETHEVWDKADPNTTHIFNGVKNRNAARAAYEAMYGTPYANTRSKKL